MVPPRGLTLNLINNTREKMYEKKKNERKNEEKIQYLTFSLHFCFETHFKSSKPLKICS